MRTLIKTSLALLLIAATTEAYGTTLYKLTDATARIESLERDVQVAEEQLRAANKRG